MAISIVSDDRLGLLDKAQAFKAFAKDLIADLRPVEDLDAVPGDQYSWRYRSADGSHLTVACRLGLSPLRKEAVSSLFGDFTLARLQANDHISMLFYIGDLIDDTADSARAHYEKIRQVPENERFYIYDSTEMLEIAARHNRIAAAADVSAWAEETCGIPPERCDLLLGSDLRLWLIELGGSGGFIILDALGAPMPGSELQRLPWKSIQKTYPTISQDSVINDRLKSAGASTISSIRSRVDTSQDGLLFVLEGHRRLRQQQEALITAGRRIICPERGQSICLDFERLALTFFDRIGHEAQQGPDRTSSLQADEVSMTVAAVRLASLHLSAKWIHNEQHRVVGDIGDFVRQAIAKANFSAAWTGGLVEHTSAMVSAVSALSEPNQHPEYSLLETIGAFCIHLAAAFGPYCEQYRSSLHYNLMPDDPPDLAGSPQFDSVWVDPDAQVVKVALEAPSPRIHRMVTTNRNLLQEVLERAEDLLGPLGAQLPFTRIHLIAQKSNFELVECFFELEDEHVLKIFMGEELYSRKDVWVRELLQNAIDATLLRRALLDERGFRPMVAISYNARSREVQVYDNGVGMSLYHVRKFFSKIGRSYYRSPELEDELRKRNRKFRAISKFGVGFLSAFMVATSATIDTFHAMGNQADEGLHIYIPGLREDFYIHRVPTGPPGTKVLLQLKEDLKGSLIALVRQYFLCPAVDIAIVENGVRYEILATEKLTVIPTIVEDADWTARFELISVDISGDGYQGLICVPIPRVSAALSESKTDALWTEVPDNRVALAQAGIWVKDENKIFGEKRGYGDTYHPYFRRVYGLVNFEPDKLKLNVSRNEFMLEDAAVAQLRKELITKTSSALVDFLEKAAARFTNTRERDEYLRSVLFATIEDGEHYYYSRNTPSARYDYSNSELLTDAMAGIYAKFVTLDQRTAGPGQANTDTLAGLLKRMETGGLYITTVQDIERESLFKAWLAEQPTDTRVLFVRTKREGALLLRGLKVLGHRAGATELSRNDLRAAIRYELVSGPLDEYLRACAGVVEFGDYKPTTAVLVMPISEHTVSKATGLTTNRSDCGEAPFVLLDRAHWLPEFLLQAADLAVEHESIRPPLREVCEMLVRDIALGSTKAVRRESVQAANIWLTKLYAVIDGLDAGSDWQALQKRKMLVMSEIIGLGKPGASR